MVIMLIMFIIIQICPELKENLVAHVQSFTPHQVSSVNIFVFQRKLVLGYVHIKQAGNKMPMCEDLLQKLLLAKNYQESRFHIY